MFWGLFSLTLAIYAIMLGWSLPLVAASAGGLTPFDMRPGGYGFAEAHAFLAALSTEGAEFYRSVQQRLDLFYPGLIAGTLFFSVAALLPRRLGVWRWTLAVIALPVAVFDYLENHAIAAMIDVGTAGLTPKLVESASQWTGLKATASTVAMSIVLLLLIWRAGQRFLPKLRVVIASRPVTSFIVLALGLSAAVQPIAVRVELASLEESRTIVDHVLRRLG